MNGSALKFLDFLEPINSCSVYVERMFGSKENGTLLHRVIHTIRNI